MALAGDDHLRWCSDALVTAPQPGADSCAGPPPPERHQQVLGQPPSVADPRVTRVTLSISGPRSNRRQTCSRQNLSPPRPRPRAVSAQRSSCRVPAAAAAVPVQRFPSRRSPAGSCGSRCPRRSERAGRASASAVRPRSLVFATRRWQNAPVVLRELRGRDERLDVPFAGDMPPSRHSHCTPIRTPSTQLVTRWMPMSRPARLVRPPACASLSSRRCR